MVFLEEIEVVVVMIWDNILYNFEMYPNYSAHNESEVECRKKTNEMKIHSDISQSNLNYELFGIFKLFIDISLRL